MRCQLAIAEYHLSGIYGFDLDYQQAYDIVEELCEYQYAKAFLMKGRLCSIQKT